MPDVNLMWIGHRALLDPTPDSNIAQTEADAIRNWTAEGREQIAAVQLNGNSYGGGYSRAVQNDL